MSDLAEIVNVWKQTAEGWKARCEFLEAENQRLRELGTTDQVSAPLPQDVDAVIMRYSFGDPRMLSETRTFARTQLAAGVSEGDVLAMIRRGAYQPEDGE